MYIYLSIRSKNIVVELENSFYIYRSRTSAPLVKVNSTYMKHKVWLRQPCCPG